MAALLRVSASRQNLCDAILFRRGWFGLERQSYQNCLQQTASEAGVFSRLGAKSRWVQILTSDVPRIASSKPTTRVRRRAHRLLGLHAVEDAPHMSVRSRSGRKAASLTLLVTANESRLLKSSAHRGLVKAMSWNHLPRFRLAC
jgi:hypothetical protein